VRLTVVGCSGSVPAPDAACSCYLVEADGYRLLLDLGNGALGPLQRHLRPADVDAVLLSHLHQDHCADLGCLYVARAYDPTAPKDRPPTLVLGPAGVEAIVPSNVTSPDGVRRQLDIRTLTAGTIELGGLRVTAARVDHPVEAYGFRVEHAGGAFAYTGDSGPCDALDRLAAGVDLLLAEAAFDDDWDAPAHVHLTGGQAGALAARGGAGRLVLTHLPPWISAARATAAARAAYQGPIDVAEPGHGYEIGQPSR
jgi:ribonuclease BN (tRNA processing enzyme)